MKAVLMCFSPNKCAMITSGKKTIEVRKTKPKLETPFKCYIYCTNTKPYLVWGDVFRGDWETEFTHLNGYNRKDVEKIWDVFNGKVIGEFVCDKLERIAFCGSCNYDLRLMIVDENLRCTDISKEYLNQCQLSYADIMEYANGSDVYGWYISDLVIYDKPKELRLFQKAAKTEHCGWGECDLCKHGYFDENERWFCKNVITRPPRSWYYVEELS